jgi:hypothetical protein
MHHSSIGKGWAGGSLWQVVLRSQLPLPLATPSQRPKGIFNLSPHTPAS